MPYSAFENHDLPLHKFESMLKTNSIYFFDSEDFQEIIHHYLETGKVALAKKAIKIGLEQHPSSTELKLLNVEVLVFENNFIDADLLLNEIETIEPSNEDVYIQKANIYSKQDNHLNAIKLLSKALSLAIDNTADIHSLMGMEYLFLDNYLLAKNSFIKCLEDDYEDYSALYNVIYCFDFLEDFDGAIKFLNNYLEKNPYCEVAWHQLGRQFISKKMYKEALTSFDFAIYSDDNFIGAYLEKGKVLEKLKRYNEAIENYEITLELDDPTSFAYLRIGKCHEKLENIELAKNYLYKAVHEDPLLDKGWIAITDFYINQRDFQKALHYINKAINIDEQNVSYWKRNAEINSKLHLHEEAGLSYQRIIELGNYELQTWISWVDTQLKLGEYKNAIETLLQAIEFYPEQTELEYRLAGIYFTLLDNSNGSYHLKNALRNDFNDLGEFKKLFPKIHNKASVQIIIETFKKASI